MVDPAISKQLHDQRRRPKRTSRLDSKRGGYSRTTMKIKGAKDVISLAESKRKKQVDKFDEVTVLKQASYLFVKSVRNEGGKFNPQHGGYELTGRRGMKMLENRERIKDIVSKAHDNATNEKVRSIMIWWGKSAYHLYEMGLIMKSQSKVGKKRYDELEDHFCLVS